jgi:spore coat protein A
LDSGQPFIQIGTDGGLLRHPLNIAKITLAPAERVDVVIDFSRFKGKAIVLKNNAPIPFPHGNPVNPQTTANIMQFRVTQPLASKDSLIPSKLSSFKSFPIKLAKKTRNHTFVETKDNYGRPKLLFNNRAWHDPATEIVNLGDVEIWNLINPTAHTHPIHLHLVLFQIIYRRPFDVKHFTKTGKVLFTGPPVSPPLNERGLKDVISTNPGEVTSIITRFGPYTGEYMWHCHILEHEDYDMMRPFIVRRNTQEKTKNPTT